MYHAVFHTSLLYWGRRPPPILIRFVIFRYYQFNGLPVKTLINQRIRCFSWSNQRCSNVFFVRKQGFKDYIIWNSLPPDVQLCFCFKTFKSRLNPFLFRWALTVNRFCKAPPNLWTIYGAIQINYLTYLPTYLLTYLLTWPTTYASTRSVCWANGPILKELRTIFSYGFVPTPRTIHDDRLICNPPN